MRKSLHVSCMLMVLTAVLFTTPVFGQKLNAGWFYHRPSNSYLLVEKADGGLVVKQSEESSWIFFRKKRPGVYFDNRGNRIEIWNSNKISFVPVKSRRGKIFFKYLEDNFKNDNDHIMNRADERSTKLEGLWFDEEQNIYLILVETRDGIKARLRDDRKWVFYHHDTYPDRFVSSSGDHYALENGVLTYYHHDRIHTIQFIKISDTFDGY